jgi:predicted nucleic acid-binding protein
MLDSTVVIDLLRERGAAYDRLQHETGPFYVSAITVDEIVYGLRPTENEQADWLVRAFLVAPAGAAEARLSAEWRREFASQGITLSVPDTLIAASAFIRRATLATANVRDFPMSELRVEHWPG